MDSNEVPNDNDKRPGVVEPPEELPTTGDPTSEESLLAGSLNSQVNKLSKGKRQFERFVAKNGMIKHQKTNEKGLVYYLEIPSSSTKVEMSHNFSQKGRYLKPWKKVSKF